MSLLHALRIGTWDTLDALLTLAIVSLAVGLVVGYQVLGRIRAALEAAGSGLLPAPGGDG